MTGASVFDAQAEILTDFLLGEGTQADQRDNRSRFVS